MTISKSQLIFQTAEQYWQLIRILFFNYKTFGYLSAIFISLAIIPCVLGFLFPVFWQVSGPMIFLAMIIFALIGLMCIPMGVLSVLASKQVYLLPKIREKLFVILFCFCVFFAAAMPLVFHHMDKKPFSVIFAASIFAAGAVYCWLTIFFARRIFLAIVMVPVLLGSQAKLFINYATALHPASFFLVGIIIWVLFHRWWVTYGFGRINSRSFFVETNPKRLQGFINTTWIFPSSHRIANPVGSLLLGHGDNVVDLVKKSLFIAATTLAFSIFASGGFKNGAFTPSAFPALLAALAYLFVIAGIDFLGQRMINNVKRCWLIFDGNRIDLFHFLECYFLHGLAVLIVLSLGIIFTLLLITENLGYLPYCLCGVTILSLVLILNFYTNSYLFCNKKIVLGGVNFQKFIINIISFIPPIAYLVSKFGTFNVYEIKDIIALLLVFALGISLKAIRNQCISQWRRFDF